jgi:hypothetical protein
MMIEYLFSIHWTGWSIVDNLVTDLEVVFTSDFRQNELGFFQFSYCRIYNISDQAFVGLDSSLQNLNLQGNRLKSVPSPALNHLASLRLLDLSGNHINVVPDGAFGGLQLETLKVRISDISAMSIEEMNREILDKFLYLFLF